MVEGGGCWTWQLTNRKAASVADRPTDRHKNRIGAGWVELVATKQSARQVAGQKTVIQFAIENRTVGHWWWVGGLVGWLVGWLNGEKHKLNWKAIFDMIHLLRF